MVLLRKSNPQNHNLKTAAELGVRIHMNKSECPHCRKNLSLKLISSRAIAGQRKMLPDHAVLFCPFCNNEIHLNFHPAHIWITLSYLPFIICVWGSTFFQSSKQFAFILIALVLFGSIVTFFLYLKFLRHLPKYCKENKVFGK